MKYDVNRPPPKRPGVRRILWYSRHPPLPSQEAALYDLFGCYELLEDTRTFVNADQLVKWFREIAGDELVVVAPLTVIERLCRLGIRPLRAEMQRCLSADDPDAELHYDGWAFRFVEFRRIDRIDIHYTDVLDASPATGD